MSSNITIDGAVGERGNNAKHNVMAVQVMINHFIRSQWLGNAKKLKIDGKYGKNTRARLIDLQVHYVPSEAPFQTITPGGPTIQFFNRNHDRATFGGPPPKPEPAAPVKPVAPVKPTPPNFVRTLWPRPQSSGHYGRSTGHPAPVPPGVGIKFPFHGLEMDDPIEFGSMAILLSSEASFELKAPPAKAKAVGADVEHWIDRFSSGRGVEVGPAGRKLGSKIAGQLTDTIGVEIASSWTVNDFRKFEEAALAGDIKKIGGEMAAAKINFSVFQNAELEVAFTPSFPCPIAVQGKYLFPADKLLAALGAPPSVVKEASGSKVEIAGTIHFGPSKQAWLKIGRRIGADALQKLFRKVGPEIAKAFVRYGNLLGIALMAKDFVQYQISMHEHFVKMHDEHGRWLGQVTEYANGYAMTLGLRDAQMMPLGEGPGLRARNAGIHDAKLAALRYGRNTVVKAVVAKFIDDPDADADPIKWYFDSKNNVQAVAAQLDLFMTDNPTLIAGQLKV
ncbi:MAG: hypothetical protein AAF318_01805 [Pseudomonadota bacterium]